MLWIKYDNRILVLLLILLTNLVLFTSCSENSNAMNLIEIWTKTEWPPEKLNAPKGFKINPYEAFLIIAENKKLSLKHRWICYRDDKYYYIADTFSHPPNADTALKYGIRVNGQTGEVQ